jgi:type I restriction enzyme R subunit
MNPEERARAKIDLQLEECGWCVQNRDEMNIFASKGVAVREFSMSGAGEADYLLYADGKAIGVVEAKPVEWTLKGVELQSSGYMQGLPKEVPAHRRPLPFGYETTGTVTQFTNALEPEARSREVFAFHRPEELVRLARLERQTRLALAEMPPLNEEGLWPAQVEAITNLEASFSENRPRSLIQMATGSGKTFTAVSAVDRLVRFGGAKRVLFLVDRKNLGTQTLTEFQQYVSPYSGYSFTDEYNVQHLRSNRIEGASRVVVTTVQRLYSMLKGEEEFEEEREEGSLFEAAPALGGGPVAVAYNPRIPIEAFDFVIVDECHRSIYNLWRQVLEYFDAFIVGLTATPSKNTIGFFFENLVMEYSHRRAVADGVNVEGDVYRIRTKITEGGATLEAEPNFFVPRRDRRTRERRYAELDDDLTYTANQLDRDVVSEGQIRLVVRTFRERLFTEIFPGRENVPKTLIFAKDDSHADDITRIVRHEFGKQGSNAFCQKITYRTTGKKPEELLQEFRTAFYPRIAVSVDMIATGTDVKPLECLLFLRNVKSANYLEQMKGRGTRIVDNATLKTVTPDTDAKTRFVIVDAVGVTEGEKNEPTTLERQPSVPLEKLLGAVATGAAGPDLASSLASRLIRLDKRIDPDQREDLASLAGGMDLKSLVASLVKSTDPDAQAERASEEHGLPVEELTEEQLEEAGEEMIKEALKPLHNPALRKRILEVAQTSEQVLDETTIDELLEAGFDAEATERARRMVEGFERFIEDNKDEIEALRVLYSRPYRAGLRYRQVKELALAIRRPPLNVAPEHLWRAYEALEAGTVRKGGGTHLTDLISLVRHAFDHNETLRPFAEEVGKRYSRWLAEQEEAGASFTTEQRRWLDAICNHIATSLRIEREDFEYGELQQLGGLGRVYRVFGEDLTKIIEEFNERVAA